MSSRKAEKGSLLKRGGDKWQPIKISELENFLISTLGHGVNVPNSRNLRKNLAYNLQYLELQAQILGEIDLTSVLSTQTWKCFIVFTVSIIEGVLYWLLLERDKLGFREWETVCKTESEARAPNKARILIRTEVLKVATTRVTNEVTFEALRKHAEKYRVLGDSYREYVILKELQRLRNRIHLHDFKKAKSILKSVFSALSPEASKMLYFLN
jgi:hypothetical protein